eukprot:163682_1
MQEQNMDELSFTLEPNKISNPNNTNTMTETKTSEDIDIDSENHNTAEEKESSNDLGELSYCRGMSKTPLAVPMVADTQTQSVTRNDAKAITNSRLKRLKELSQRPETQLSKDQQNEKKRIIRLEKNRRAAAMSRRKKKMYVKNLEDKYNLMVRHLSILEMENAHLRAMLNAPHHPMAAPLPMPNCNMRSMPSFNKMPHFPHHPKVTNFTSSSNSCNADNSISETPNASTNTSSVNHTAHHSVEPNIQNVEPVMKRRRLNDGSSVNTSCDNTSDDISILEPLPINGLNTNNRNIPTAPPPGVPINFMPQNHMMRHMMPQYGQPHMMRHLMHYHPHAPIIKSNRGMSIDNGNESDDKNSVEMHQINHNNQNNNEIPPDIQVPELPTEFVPMLDDDIIEETVDEYGSINDMIYL